MTEFGYTLSAEEHGPADLVRWARTAEETGFSFALISDHFHPWIDRQGHSPFVWTVLGGIAQATERLRVGTGVTCPLRSSGDSGMPIGSSLGAPDPNLIEMEEKIGGVLVHPIGPGALEFLRAVAS